MGKGRRGIGRLGEGRSGGGGLEGGREEGKSGRREEAAGIPRMEQQLRGMMVVVSRGVSMFCCAQWLTCSQ